MVDYEISGQRVSTIDLLWSMVEQMHLTDRADWRKLGKTKSYQLLGMELNDFVRNHSAEDIQHVYRIIGQLLLRLDEAMQP